MEKLSIVFLSVHIVKTWSSGVVVESTAFQIKMAKNIKAGFPTVGSLNGRSGTGSVIHLYWRRCLGQLGVIYIWDRNASFCLNLLGWLLHETTGQSLLNCNLMQIKAKILNVILEKILEGTANWMCICGCTWVWLVSVFNLLLSFKAKYLVHYNNAVMPKKINIIVFVREKKQDMERIQQWGRNKFVKQR